LQHSPSIIIFFNPDLRNNSKNLYIIPQADGGGNDSSSGVVVVVVVVVVVAIIRIIYKFRYEMCEIKMQNSTSPCNNLYCPIHRK
jgi:hypothetical protein